MSCPAGFSTSKRAPFADATETLVPGQRFQWWDYDIMWSTKHFRASQLEPLRQIGDVLADNALAALDIKPGQDALVAMREYTSRPVEEQLSDAPRKLLEQLMTVPEWVDWEKVKRGQDVYWKYVLYISHALLHFSLAGGFSIPKITKVLNSTGYLNGNRTKERVLDTNQFLLDVVHSTESLSPGFGHTGWESIIQVRFLHAGVRSRLSKISRAHSKYYNVEEHGIAINQEDLLATLFSFSNAMWRVMDDRMNVRMTTSEREDYLHLWRYIGHVIGVDDVLAAATSPERADACLESIVLHLTDPDEHSGKMCATLLHNMAAPTRVSRVLSALGLPDPVKVHLALAENLLGPSFWTINGLPRMSRPYRLLMAIVQYFLAFELWVHNKAPWWARQARRSLLREAMNMVAAKQTGRDRTQFQLKAIPKDGGALDSDMEFIPEERFAQHSGVWPKVLTAASAAVGVASVVALRA
ncbi:hypothetical protein BG004_006490 [Podila humilis]|nr:hypothetical protein BG004_006490 [Podila humilis]